jgi:hypothetical protein
MKIIITAKTGRGEDSTEKEIDNATDKLENLMYYVDENFKGFKWTGLKCMCDGTQIIMEK